MDKLEMLTQSNIIKAIGHPKSDIELSFGECGIGTDHYLCYVSIGNMKLTDKQHHKTLYWFAVEVEKIFADIQQKLAKKRIFLVWSDQDFEYVRGGMDMWGCRRMGTIRVPSRIVRIEVAPDFEKVQKWVNLHTRHILSATDLYTCNAIKKHSSVWYSDYEYVAADKAKCARMLETIQKAFKRGYKVKDATFTPKESYNNPEDLYDETEVYGHRHVQLYVTITTATGRNEQVMRLG